MGRNIDLGDSFPTHGQNYTLLEQKGIISSIIDEIIKFRKICSPPQSAAGTPWQSQADFRESVSKNVVSFYDYEGLSARKSYP